MKKEAQPLNLPKGSVRAIITLALVLIAIFALFLDDIVFIVILPIVTLVIGYYLGRRSFS
jgi:uncharacterized membrane protein